MAVVSINGDDYPSYADVEFADAYLAADVLRASAWAALTEDPEKGRALVSATRLLQRQRWVAGVPETEAPVEAVSQATALLAADIALKPTLGDSAATGSNIKAVGAGSARVEFFAPVALTVLPPAVLALLRGLLGPDPSTASDPALTNSAYGSSNCQHSRFDPTDYGMIGDGRGPVDVDERLY